MEKTWKSSSSNSISMYRNRVQQTRFPCTENEFIELVFIELGIWTLSLNSEDGKLVPSLATSAEDGPYPCSESLLLANQFLVHDRFPCMENEFNELIFHTWKLSSLNSVSVHGNGVR